MLAYTNGNLVYIHFYPWMHSLLLHTLFLYILFITTYTISVYTIYSYLHYLLLHRLLLLHILLTSTTKTKCLLPHTLFIATKYLLLHTMLISINTRYDYIHYLWFPTHLTLICIIYYNMYFSLIHAPLILTSTIYYNTQLMHALFIATWNIFACSIY